MTNIALVMYLDRINIFLYWEWFVHAFVLILILTYIYVLNVCQKRIRQNKAPDGFIRHLFYEHVFVALLYILIATFEDCHCLKMSHLPNEVLYFDISTFKPEAEGSNPTIGRLLWSNLDLLQTWNKLLVRDSSKHQNYK